MPSTSSVSAISFPRARRPSEPMRQTIDLAQTLEVLSWSQALGCSEAELRLAVAEVGPELDEVRNHLGLPSTARLGPAAPWH